MPVALLPRRWWNFYMSENEKIEVEPLLLINVFSASLV